RGPVDHRRAGRVSTRGPRPSREELVLHGPAGPAARRARAARLLVLAATVLSASPALAWGPIVHQRVTSEAIDTLPKGLKPFYKAHRLETPPLSLEEPPATDESTDRRFAMDRLMPFPFLEMPHTEDALKSKFPDLAGKVGRLPWLIQESYARLVEAFRSGAKAKILD